MNSIDPSVEDLVAKAHAKIKGFTLLELVMVSTLILILAIPTFMGYQFFMTKARRLEANIVLTNLLSQAEQYLLKNNKYPDRIEELSIPESQYYTYGLKTCGPGCIEITATANSGTLQSLDKECNILMINSHGDKKPANSKCWKK